MEPGEDETPAVHAHAEPASASGGSGAGDSDLKDPEGEDDGRLD
jgi:hypothetical protein